MGEKKAEKGDDAKALKIAQFFNSQSNSPWCDRIQFAHEVKSQHHTISQTSFVKSIKRTILTKNHPLSRTSSERDKQFKILLNFWIAVERIFVTQSETQDAVSKSVVFKSNGLEFFHSISGPMINILAKNETYTADAIEECLKSAESFLPPDVAGVMSPEYWQRGNEVSSQSKGGMEKLASAFSEALGQANESDISL